VEFDGTIYKPDADVPPTWGYAMARGSFHASDDVESMGWAAQGEGFNHFVPILTGYTWTLGEASEPRSQNSQARLLRMKRQ